MTDQLLENLRQLTVQSNRTAPASRAKECIQVTLAAAQKSGLPVNTRNPRNIMPERYSCDFPETRAATVEAALAGRRKARQEVRRPPGTRMRCYSEPCTRECVHQSKMAHIRPHVEVRGKKYAASMMGSIAMERNIQGLNKYFMSSVGLHREQTVGKQFVIMIRLVSC